MNQYIPPPWNDTGEAPRPIDERRSELVRQNEERALDLAKDIQRIEHDGTHTWESCAESARKRALRQARACIRLIRLKGLPEEVEPSLERSEIPAKTLPNLTPAELNVLQLLAQAWDAYISLPGYDPDIEEFRHAIHNAQCRVALRVAQRVDKNVWRQNEMPEPQHRVNPADAILHDIYTERNLIDHG